METYLYQGKIFLSIQRILTSNMLEFLPINLGVVIQIHILGINQIRSILYQILCGLKYIHSTHVVHRDLKLANILMNPPTGEIKICDFSLASELCHERPLTAHMSTLWYHAPKVILSPGNYGKPSK